MRKGVSIALLALAALAAGCDSSGKSDASAGPAVAWVPARPPQAVPRTAKAAPCRSRDVVIADGVVQFRPDQSGGGIALIPIRNTGRRACSLTGRPTVRMVKKDGPEQQVVPLPAFRQDWPAVAYPDSWLDALRPGETAALQVTWSNWCDPQIAGKKRTPPTALRITLPHGRGNLDADYNAVPECLQPSTPSRIGVGPFQPATVPVGTPFSTAVLRASIPDQPLHATRGGVLRYRVVLRNPSQQTVGFARCPAYVQLIAPTGKMDTYRLNCAGARPIAPGESLALDMRIEVPETAPLGANGLFWMLDPFGAQSPQVNARVLVEPSS